MTGTAVPERTTHRLAAAQVDIMAGDLGGPRLVFVNGELAPGSSHHREVPGVEARAGSERGAAVVVVEAPTVADAPIHVVHVAVPDPDTTVVNHPSTVVEVRDGARATVVESYVGFTGDARTDAETVIDVGDGATLDYHRVQVEPPTASHTGLVRIRAGDDASVTCTSFTIGAHTSRVVIDAGLVGDRSRLDVAGLYVLGGDDRHDHLVTADHQGSHTHSSQRFHGVVDHRAQGSFTGHVIVAPGTVDTEANQTNHSLLLSGTARSDTQPWLEILADDVRCAHGATVGRLDDDAVFYLRSRGIPEEEARRLLVEGFTGEIVDVVAEETLRAHLCSRIRAKQQRPRVER